MGVSAAQGSAGLKQGVCTSTTRPSNPYEGQMIYETDTDLTLIWGGTAWQQVSGGTAVGNSGLVYVTSATIGNAVSSVTVSSAFSATYDNYQIKVTGGVASALQNLSLTLGSSVTGYFDSGIVVDYSGAAISGLSDNNAAAFTRTSVGNTNGFSMSVNLDNPFLAKPTFYRSDYFGYASQSGYLTGVHTVASSFTAFTITPAGGATLTGGTIRVYGYRQA